MILFGTNFNLYYYLLLGNFAKVFKSEELRWYLGIVAAAVGMITINILPLYGYNPLRSFRYAFFQGSSIITTTGFTSADYGSWPVFSQAILIMIMFFGAMAGSTGGGIKISGWPSCAKMRCAACGRWSFPAACAPSGLRASRWSTPPSTGCTAS